MGFDALRSNLTGDENTAVGDSALANNTTGSANIALGRAAGSSVFTASNVIAIGMDDEDVSNSCYIGRIFTATSSQGIAVLINSDGKLGTTTSSERFKDAIKPMDRASELLFALKPVTFHYKKEIDPADTSQFGLVAEEVEKVNPDLVVRDKEGKPYSVRYDAVNAMLLNEFLKEHRKNEEQEKTIAELKSGMTALAATVKEQAAQIQKVGAQLEASKPAPQVVNNPQRERDKPRQGAVASTLNLLRTVARSLRLANL
jgi:trimeric autotransporter adhesin